MSGLFVLPMAIRELRAARARVALLVGTVGVGVSALVAIESFTDNLRTSVELYTIWEATGVLKQLESVDENLFDVVSDVMEEKRDEWEEWLEDNEDGGDDED